MNKLLLQKNLNYCTNKIRTKVLLALFAFCFFCFSTGHAQTVAYNYNFSESSGQPYTDLTTGTVLVSGTFTSIATLGTYTLPFTFNYNGTAHTQVTISDNGFIVVGPTAVGAAVANPINGTGFSNAIAGYGMQLYGVLPSAEVRYDVIGSAPNRVFVAQYRDLQRRQGVTTTPGLINMQIRLYETSNVVEVLYKDLFSSTSTLASTGQVGLKGNSNADFNTRRNLTNPIYPATDVTSANNQGLITAGQASGVATQGWLAGTQLLWTPCFAPTAITATLLGDNSTLNINWTNPSLVPAGGFDWEVTTSATPSTGIFASGNTSSNFVSVPGLSTGITYYIRVKPNCKATWLNGTPATITPTCPIATIPYTQDFESVTTPAIPTCNSVLAIAGALMVTQDNTATAYYGFNNKNLITTGALAQNTWYFTQGISVTAADITASGGSFRLSYKYGGSREQAFFEQKMRVYYGAAASVVGMTTLLADHNSIKLSPINGVINFTISAPGTYYFGFNGYANASQGFLQLDDINLDYSTCLQPTALTSGQITPTSAIISWTPPASLPAGGYQYLVSTVNTPPIATSLPTGSTDAGVTLTTLTGLTPSTTYYYWVRSNCGGETSIWSLVGTFVTLAPPPVPCIPSGATFPQDPNGITNVTMGSINNTTGIEANNYGDYTSLTTNAAQGSTLPVSITFATGFDYNTNIWVDWNNDGDFTDPGELEWQGVASNANPTTIVGNITVLAGEPLGPRRVRIGGIDFGPFTDPCRNGNYQAFEDYSIYIINPPPPLTLSGTSNIICSGDPTPPVTLTSNPADFQVYTWTPVGGVSGTVGTGWTFTPTTTTTYILTATQTSGSFASNTASYTITVNPLPTTITITPASTTTCQNATTGTALIASGGIVSGVDIMSENFNGATNTFTTVNNSSPATVTPTNNPADAAWTLRPSPYLYNGFTTFSSNDASQFYLSNSDDQGSAGTTNTQLISPVFSLAAPITNASLSFWHVYRGWSSGTATVEISTNGGGTWAAIPTLSWSTNSVGTTTNFVNVTANLAAYLGNANCRIRFNYANANFGWFWGIDNVRVTGSSVSDITWSPLAGLWNDAAKTSPYLGTATSTVYASPNGTTTYSAEAISLEGCPTQTNVTVTVTPVNGGTASANQTISCGATPADLTVTGNTGTVIRWESSTTLAFTTPVIIPASASNTLLGSQMLPITAPKYFRAVIQTGSCPVAYSNVITISLASTSWQLPGPAWTNGAPTIGTAAIFNANYTSTGDLSACSVTVNPGAAVVFNSNHTLTVENAVNVSGGTLTFENNASLLQVSNAVNTGNITYRRNTTPMRRFDYTYWSSPVAPQTLFALSPNTLSDKYFFYNTTINNWQSIPSSNLMVAGTGYIIRGPQTFSTTVPAIFPAQFVGIPNNGTIATNITVGVGTLNCIGNPYPSAINADLFLSDSVNDSRIGGTIYLWTHNTPITANSYTFNDFALYTYSGGIGTGTAAVNTGTGNNSIPTGRIAAGQGFMIEGSIPASTNPVFFRNSMRVTGNNSQFYRYGSEDRNSNSNVISSIEKHRVWLEVFNDEGSYKQILVGYIENATDDLDRGYDGKVFDLGNQVFFYTMVAGEKLGIQGKALPFDVNDIEPLGFKSTTNGTYHISLSDFDGLFENQDVYLEDLYTATIHDLKSGNYSFTTGIGTFEDRFVLRYTNSILNTNQAIFNENSVIIYKDLNNDIILNSSSVVMDTIQVFDARGRQLFSQNKVNTNRFVISDLNSSEQLLIVTVTSQDGQKVTKKIIF